MLVNFSREEYIHPVLKAHGAVYDLKYKTTISVSLWKNLKPNLTSVGHILHVGIGEEACPPGADVGGCAVEGDRGAEPARDPQVGDGGRQGRPQAGHPVTHLHILNVLLNKGPKNNYRLRVGRGNAELFSWEKTTFPTSSL